MEEVSSSEAVIEMQEFSDSDDKTYEVPVQPPSAVLDGLNPVGFVSTNTGTVHLYPVVLPSPSPQEEEQSGAAWVNDHTLPKTVEEEHDPYIHTPPTGWSPPVMNIAHGSISIPLKEKIPSKLKEVCWVLHQGMQTENIIKRGIHRHVQTDTKKKIVRHIHIPGDLDMRVTNSVM